MNRAMIKLAGAALALLGFLAVGCGSVGTPPIGGTLTTSAAPATASTTTAKEDVTHWYATVSHDVDKYVSDAETNDYSDAGLATLLADIHNLQADPEFPKSAPADVRNSWTLALADMEEGLTAARNGDMTTGSSKLMDGTSELSAVTDYVNSLA